MHHAPTTRDTHSGPARNPVIRVAILGMLAGLLGACAAADLTGGDACTTSTDCDNGLCIAGECVSDEDVGSTDGDGQIAPESSTNTPPPESDDASDRAGGYLAPCSTGDDCESGICLSSPQGRVCTRFCANDVECEGAAGWTCQLVSGTGRDLTEICYPDSDDLCSPCQRDTDCGGVSDRCIALSNGTFCAMDCRAGASCPEGFVCNELGDGDSQCLPAEDLCGPCRFADLMSNTEHCGECDNACITPNAIPACNNGFCEVFSCDSGWHNCDGEVLTGCETRTASDPENCGECGLDCGDDPCTNGTCGCPGEQIVCDGECRTPNICGGCEDLGGQQPGDSCGPCDEDTLACEGTSLVCSGDTALNECGGCEPLDGTIGEPCGPCDLDQKACQDGALACNGETWINPCGTCEDLGDQAFGEPCGPCGIDTYVCDGTGTVCSGATEGNACGGCSALNGEIGDPCGRCNAGELACDGETSLACINEPDFDTDRHHCGQCDNFCSAGRQCVDGECRCPEGQVFCNGACQPDNGCGGCAPIPEPGTSCGDCNNGTRVCNGSNEVICQGAATNPCGGCNLIDVNLGDTCQSCGQYVCSGSQVICQGGANLQSDRNNCGQCGNQCQGPQNCVSGNCQCPNAGETLCSGVCVNTNADSNNCGQCGSQCLPPRTCNNGQCVCPNSNESFCGGQCINTSSDNSNCGSCGNQCGSGRTCQNGSCSCPSGSFSCGSGCWDPLRSCGQCGTGLEVCFAITVICAGHTTNACGGCENASTQCNTCDCGNEEIGCATWACSGGTDLYCSPGCPSGYNCEGTRCRSNN